MLLAMHFDGRSILQTWKMESIWTNSFKIRGNIVV